MCIYSFNLCVQLICLQTRPHMRFIKQINRAGLQRANKMCELQLHWTNPPIAAGYGKPVDMQTRVQLCTMRSRHYLTASVYCAIIIMYNLQCTREQGPMRPDWSNDINCYYYYYIRWTVLERGSLRTAGCIATIGMLRTNPSPLLTDEVGTPCSLSYRLQIIATIFCNWFAIQILKFATSSPVLRKIRFFVAGGVNFTDVTDSSFEPEE